MSRGRVLGRADLDQVRVPGILGDAEVIITLLLYISISTDSSAPVDSVIPSSCPCQRRGLVANVSSVSVAEAFGCMSLTILGSSHEAASHCCNL